jgi:hypothetical protein
VEGVLGLDGHYYYVEHPSQRSYRPYRRHYRHARHRR